MSRCLLWAACLLLLAGCVADPRPRPYAYPRIELPPHRYQAFDRPECPFTFEYPVYGQLEDQRIDSCFFNLYFPRFDCRWHITARTLDPARGVTYHFTLEDFRQLVHKHTRKGSVYESYIETPHGRGVFYELYGEVPTSADFFFSDSAHYALTTSFYFNTALRNDSLKPVIDYMKRDLLHMVETLRWK